MTFSQLETADTELEMADSKVKVSDSELGMADSKLEMKCRFREMVYRDALDTGRSVQISCLVAKLLLV